MKKDITPLNDKFQPHGLWERCWVDGQLWFRTVYINGKENGFEEWHSSDATISFKRYYL